MLKAPIQMLPLSDHLFGGSSTGREISHQSKTLQAVRLSSNRKVRTRWFEGVFGGSGGVQHMVSPC